MSLFRKFINFIWRPDIDAQNTGHAAFQQYQGYALASYGGTGINSGTMRAVQAANIAPGPTHKLNDPTVTGNVGSTLHLNPLSKNNLNSDADAGMISPASF